MKRGKKRTENLFKETVAQVFPNLMKSIHLNKNQQILSAIKVQRLISNCYSKNAEVQLQREK